MNFSYINLNLIKYKFDIEYQISNTKRKLKKYF